MSLVPALAEAQAARIERLKRMGIYRPNVVPMERVRVVEPEPAPEPEEIPDFLAVRKRSDWVDMTSRAAFRPATARVILSVVCRMTRVSHLDITSERRPANIIKARMIACWIMRHHTEMSLPQIGRRLGGRDHTTVLNSINRVDGFREADADYRAFVDSIVAEVEREMLAISDDGDAA